MMVREFAGLLLAISLAAVHSTAQNARSAAGTTSSIVPVDSSEIRNVLDEVKDLVRQQAHQLELQGEQIERQQREIDELRHTLNANLIIRPSPTEQERLAGSSAALLNSEVASVRAFAPTAEPIVQREQVGTHAGQRNGETGDSPLSIRFGKASLTPGGWVDFTAYYRSTDVGSGLGTSFAAIPFSNTVQGGLSETRFTAQNSRITLRADESFAGTRVFGYAEADFNGYLPSNAYVSTNSDSMRLRVYFTDIARGRWEFLGGQSWSLLTPNRSGLSPFLSEIYNTLHLDTNYQVGLTYARQTQLRSVYHFTPTVALGVSVENPQQYSGGAATFPALFSTGQTDLGSSTGAGGGTATPALHPDFIAKLSADAGWADRKWHFETSGLLTPVAILTPASVTGGARTKDIREGGGISAAMNLQVALRLHMIVTGFWSDGGGRYIGGLGPAFVVAQIGNKISPFTAQLLHSGSGIATAEWQASRAMMLSLTYSEAYFARASSRDPSTGALVGYGFAGSANSNNRVLREGSVATQTTLWKQPGYGSVQVITQSSYILRNPWYVAPGAPKDAHVFAGYANLRYVLP